MAPKTAVQGENFLVGLLYAAVLKRLYDGCMKPDKDFLPHIQRIFLSGHMVAVRGF